MEKTHKKLITVDIAYDDLYIDLHEDITITDAITKMKNKSSTACFALPPEKILELAKVLLDAVFISDTKFKNEEQN